MGRKEALEEAQIKAEQGFPVCLWCGTQAIGYALCKGPGWNSDARTALKPDNTYSSIKVETEGSLELHVHRNLIAELGTIKRTCLEDNVWLGR